MAVGKAWSEGQFRVILRAIDAAYAKPPQRVSGLAPWQLLSAWKAGTFSVPLGAKVRLRCEHITAPAATGIVLLFRLYLPGRREGSVSGSRMWWKLVETLDAQFAQLDHAIEYGSGLRGRWADEKELKAALLALKQHGEHMAVLRTLLPIPQQTIALHRHLRALQGRARASLTRAVQEAQRAIQGERARAPRGDWRLSFKAEHLNSMAWLLRVYHGWSDLYQRLPKVP